MLKPNSAMSFPHHDDRVFVRRRCGARVNRYGFRFRIAADVEVPQELEGLEICADCHDLNNGIFIIQGG
jgi:hypothetical protein